MIKNNIQKAAQFIKNSDCILIGTGAGIGKDSGLPDFRGNQGFWNHYPPYKNKFNFYECANPSFLQKEPHLFWGFYGSRLEMYRKVNPHKGFEILLNMNKKQGKQIFSLTSNVDGHFKKAGYLQEKIYEVHGSIHYLQCDSCLELKQNDFQPKINYEKMSCENLPVCKNCNEVTRPNILMFNDYTWMSQRSDKQQQNYRKFIKEIHQKNKQLCLIQIGAGTAVPTIRNMLQKNYYHNKNSKYIRINPDKQDNSKADPSRFVHLQLGSLQSLVQIQNYLSE